MNGKVLWWYSSENLSPRVTPEFLERQRRLLLPAQFAREHQNQWVDAADSFTSPADVDSAMGHGWSEGLAGEPGVEYVHAWDLGSVHDPTVGAVAHQTAGIVYVDRLVTLQGSRENPVRMALVEATMRELAQQFPASKIRIETWQGISAAQSLQSLGLPVELFTPTAKAHAEEWPILAQRLTARTLVLPSHARLREELLNLVYEVGPTGVRVVDRGAIHQDHAVAVRMAVASLSTEREIRIWGFGEPPSAKAIEAIDAERHAASAAEIKNTLKVSLAWFPGDPMPFNDDEQPRDFAEMIRRKRSE